MADVIGSGSDTLVFQMSGDADGPSDQSSSYAEFTVNVDGQQIGGLQTVTASHAAGETQTFTFQGNYGPGQHDVTVTFANNNGTPGDKSDVGDSGDRNVYVNSLTYDGDQVTNGVTPIYESPLVPPNFTDVLHPGNAVFSVNDTTAVPDDAPSTPTTTPAAVDNGSGADTLTLHMAEDPYDGDAQFTVAVDGKQVGGTFTTTAVQWQGQEQLFNLHGDWGSGPHTVSVTYLSNAMGSANAEGLAYDNQDQNLYVHSISYDGIQASGAPWELSSDGTQDFSVAAGGQPGAGSDTSATSTTATANGSGSATGSDTSATSTTTTANGSGSATGSDNGNTTVTPGTLTSGGDSSSGTSFLPPTNSDTGSSNISATGTSDSSGSSASDPTSGGGQWTWPTNSGAGSSSPSWGGGQWSGDSYWHGGASNPWGAAWNHGWAAQQYLTGAMTPGQ